MYSVELGCYISDGPRRSVVLPPRTEEFEVMEPVYVRTPKKSHSRSKSVKHRREHKASKWSEVLWDQVEGCYYQEKILSDGTRKIKPISNENYDTSTNPRKPKKDLFDPSTIYGNPDAAAVDPWPDLQEAQEEVEDKEEKEDNSGEYGTQVEFPTTVISDTTPSTTSQQEPISYYLPEKTVYSVVPKQQHRSSRDKRRENAIAATPNNSSASSKSRPSALERFFFPEIYRDGRRQGKSRNDRINVWLSDLPMGFAEDITRQRQNFPSSGVY